MVIPAEGTAGLAFAFTIGQMMLGAVSGTICFRAAEYLWTLRKLQGQLYWRDFFNAPIALTGKATRELLARHRPIPSTVTAVSWTDRPKKEAPLPDFIGYRVWTLAGDELMPRNPGNFPGGPTTAVQAIAHLQNALGLQNMGMGQQSQQGMQIAQNNAYQNYGQQVNPFLQNLLGQQGQLAGLAFQNQLSSHLSMIPSATPPMTPPAPKPPLGPVVPLEPQPEPHRPWSGPVGTAHEEPDWWNESGLYSWRRDSTEARTEFWNEISATGSWTVAGRVRHFGTVVEHTLGYRSSHAVFECLALRGHNPTLVQQLADRYQCPVQGFVDPTAMLRYLVKGE